jgi:hypothetical protein
MNPSDILKNGKDILLARGWCAKTLLNDVGNVCSVGGLRLGSRMSVYFDDKNSSEEYIRAQRILLQAMMLVDPARPYPWDERWTVTQKVARWNDTHTQSEVFTAWDKAIELAEIEEEVVIMVDTAEAERLGELVPA